MLHYMSITKWNTARKTGFRGSSGGLGNKKFVKNDEPVRPAQGCFCESARNRTARERAPRRFVKSGGRKTSPPAAFVRTSVEYKSKEWSIL